MPNFYEKLRLRIVKSEFVKQCSINLKFPTLFHLHQCDYVIQWLFLSP